MGKKDKNIKTVPFPSCDSGSLSCWSLRRHSASLHAEQARFRAQGVQENKPHSVLDSCIKMSFDCDSVS